MEWTTELHLAGESSLFDAQFDRVQTLGFDFEALIVCFPVGEGSIRLDIAPPPISTVISTERGSPRASRPVQPSVRQVFQCAVPRVDQDDFIRVSLRAEYPVNRAVCLPVQRV